MGLSVFPAAAGGGIKLVQRGQATSSGNITITAVDTSKTFVSCFSEGAAGTVATNSTYAGLPSGAAQRILPSSSDMGTAGSVVNSNNWWDGRAMAGGTMSATTKQMGVHLANSTTLTATGACRWEVVEFA